MSPWLTFWGTFLFYKGQKIKITFHSHRQANSTKGFFLLPNPCNKRKVIQTRKVKLLVSRGLQTFFLSCLNRGSITMLYTSKRFTAESHLGTPCKVRSSFPPTRRFLTLLRLTSFGKLSSESYLTVAMSSLASEWTALIAVRMAYDYSLKTWHCVLLNISLIASS